MKGKTRANVSVIAERLEVERDFSCGKRSCFSTNAISALHAVQHVDDTVFADGKASFHAGWKEEVFVELFVEEQDISSGGISQGLSKSYCRRRRS